MVIKYHTNMALDRKKTIQIGRFLSKIEKLAISQNKNRGMVETVSGNDPYKILVSCILSLRTKDELTEGKAKQLWAVASNPYHMIKIGHKKLSKTIYPVGFYNRKARQIIEISKIIIKKHGGRVPSSLDQLLELPGVGRKTANLVLSAGFSKPAICVDTHVHRIVNRWGYVKTKTPEETETALRRKLPKSYWNKINHLLVLFGKNICTPISPKCSICPLQSSCPALGVKTKR